MKKISHKQKNKIINSRGLKNKKMNKILEKIVKLKKKKIKLAI